MVQLGPKMCEKWGQNHKIAVTSSYEVTKGPETSPNVL